MRLPPESSWYEDDYQPTAGPVAPTHFVPGTRIEIIRVRQERTVPQHVLFDFDGTLSLLREGWPDVMVPMMVEVLQGTGTDEDQAALRALCNDFVMQLNGKQTIYQMLRLCDEIRRRGGTPAEPLVYKQQYHERLMRRIAHRHKQLRQGQVPPETMLVPHTLDLLDRLRERDVSLYLASGTDESYVVAEAELLGLAPYFESRIYGAIDDYRRFSKAQVIERILAENKVDGASLLGFGDGYVEIQNVKSAGGFAVAVASDESGRSGHPDPWKRSRLIGVGADLVIPDYQDADALLSYVWNE